MRHRFAPRRVFGWLAIVIGLLAAPWSARAEQTVDPDIDCAGQGELFSSDDAASFVSALPTRPGRSRQPFLSPAGCDVDPARTALNTPSHARGHRPLTLSSRERRAAHWRHSTATASDETGCRDEGTVAPPPIPVATPSMPRSAVSLTDDRLVTAHRSSTTGPRAPPSLG